MASSCYTLQYTSQIENNSAPSSKVTSNVTQSHERHNQSSTKKDKKDKASTLKFSVLQVPPIPSFDSNPLYHQGYIYVTKVCETGLKIYQYCTQNNIWREFYDFGYAAQCPLIENAVDSSNNHIYVLSKPGTRSNTTILYGLDLASKKFVCKNLSNKSSISTRSDAHSSAIVQNDLHFFNSSTIYRIPIMQNSAPTKRQRNNFFYSRKTDCGKIPHQYKSVYVESIGCIFVFGGKPISFTPIHDTRSRRSVNEANSNLKNSHNISKGTKIDNKAIWFCDIHDSEHKWRLCSARLPINSSNYGIINSLEYLIFLFEYKSKNNTIWCFDLLSGEMTKCEEDFPLSSFDEMRMIATDDDRTHFMAVNKDHAWIRQRSSEYGFKGYFNVLTSEHSWNEPKTWTDCDDYDANVLNTGKKCNFHVSCDLVDLVPRIVHKRYHERWSKLIRNLSEEHLNHDTRIYQNHFSTNLIDLVGRFTSRLYQS